MKNSFYFVFLLVTFYFSINVFAQLRLISKSKEKDKVIVFIHGLNSSSTSCWTNESFYFPQGFAEDELLKDFAVYTYDYPSICKVVTPSEAAVNLNEVLEVEGISSKSLYFVAHSLGGIVTREFLTKFPYRKVASIQLLATPNLGSSYEQIAKYLCGGVGIAKIETLGTGRGSGIDLLNDNWRVKFEQNDGKKIFKFFSAFENPLGSYPTIVEKDSALLFSSSVKYFITGHSGIAKPEGQRDEIYLWVRSNILNKKKESQLKTTQIHQEARYSIMQKQISVMKKSAGNYFTDNFIQTFNFRFFAKAKELINKDRKIPRENLQVIGAILADYQNNISEALNMYMKIEGDNKSKYRILLLRELVERTCSDRGIDCRSNNKNFRKLDLNKEQIEFLEKEIFSSPPGGFAFSY